MKHLQHAMMGFTLGTIHGIILWAAIQTLGFASWIVTKSKYTFPLQIVFVVDIVIVVTLVSAVWWLPKLERMFQRE